MKDAFLDAMKKAGVVDIKKGKSKTKPILKPKPKPKTKSKPNKKGSPPINEGSRVSGIDRAAKELELLELKVKTAEVNYQQLLKVVVLREDMERIWNRVYRSGSYFADFPSRYSGDYAAALGITDQEKIHQLERVIADSVELFISDFAESVANEI